MSFERRRLTFALLLSLLIHTFLLSLTFGGQLHWLPAFGFPWQDRRIEEPDLRVVVVPARATPAGARPAAAAQASKVIASVRIGKWTFVVERSSCGGNAA